MKILITNSVPLNGGDEALLRATIESLKLKFPGAEIKVLCLQLALCRKYLPDIDFDFSLESMKYNENSYSYRIRLLLKKLKVNWTSCISLMFATDDEKRVVSHYRNADLVISSPGGFLHDYYPVEQRLDGLEMVVNMGKKVVILAQSVGPFWQKESKRRVRKLFDKFYKIYLRDSISRQYLIDIGLPLDNVSVTADAAFLWRKLKPELFVKKSGEFLIIAVCFREWNYAKSDRDAVLDNAVRLCIHILKKRDRHIRFLSTCQGIDGYVDDSIIAAKIVQKLPDDLKAKCTINKHKYSPPELIKEYSKCDAFIGMRLHGAILSMLGGTPAMGLGYEDKTKGIFEQLGLECYQVNADANYELWIQCFERFVNDAEDIRRRLPSILDNIAKEAEKSLELL